MFIINSAMWASLGGKADQRLRASPYSIDAKIWISLGAFSNMSPSFIFFSSDSKEAV